MLQIEKFKKDLCETISRYFNEVLTIVCLLVVNVIKLENPEFRNRPQKNWDGCKIYASFPGKTNELIYH